MNNQMNRKPAVAAALIAALMIIAYLLPMTAYAGTNAPVTVDIKLAYIVKGNVGSEGGGEFTLSSDDPLSPMPEGSRNGKKTIAINKEGSFSFGDIHYEKPGIYWYTITRDPSERKGVVKDASLYRAKVIALNDGHGYVLSYRNDSDEKHELVYIDRTAPETGDAGDIRVYACIAIAAAAALAASAAAAGKNRQKEVRSDIEKNIRR